MSLIRSKKNRKATGDRRQANEPLVWAEIDLDHLRHTLEEVRRALKKPKPAILAVVKADAYGHGMCRIAKALEREGVGFFGVANIEEALELRQSVERIQQDGMLLIGFTQVGTAHLEAGRIREALAE